jgi:hypothetical protein
LLLLVVHPVPRLFAHVGAEQGISPAKPESFFAMLAP